MPTDLTDSPAAGTQDEGPQHLISTSAVKVQRLLALLHIMKEGWSLDPAWRRKKHRNIGGLKEVSQSFLLLFLFYFCLRKCLFFPCFALASVKEEFFAETNFLLLFFRHDGEKNLYRLIMLKACIPTQDILLDKHTEK